MLLEPLLKRCLEQLHQYDFVGAKIESIQPVDGDQSATALSGEIFDVYTTFWWTCYSSTCGCLDSFVQRNERAAGFYGGAHGFYERS